MGLMDEIKKEANAYSTRLRNNELKASKLKGTAYFKQKIQREGMNQYVSTIKGGMMIQPTNSMENLNKYNKLLMGKINDPELQKTIIEHANVILKHRISMDVILTGYSHTNQEVKAMFTVTGILPQHEADIQTHFIGLFVGSNDWNITLDEFRGQMAAKMRPVNAVISKLAPKDNFTIREATIIASFK